MFEAAGQNMLPGWMILVMLILLAAIFWYFEEWMHK